MLYDGFLSIDAGLFSEINDFNILAAGLGQLLLVHEKHESTKKIKKSTGTR